jgi:hypothetical protein
MHGISYLYIYFFKKNYMCVGGVVYGWNRLPNAFIQILLFSRVHARNNLCSKRCIHSFIHIELVLL